MHGLLDVYFPIALFLFYELLLTQRSSKTNLHYLVRLSIDFTSFSQNLASETQILIASSEVAHSLTLLFVSVILGYGLDNVLSMNVTDDDDYVIDEAPHGDDELIQLDGDSFSAKTK